MRFAQGVHAVVFAKHLSSFLREQESMRASGTVGVSLDAGFYRTRFAWNEGKHILFCAGISNRASREAHKIFGSSGNRVDDCGDKTPETPHVYASFWNLSCPEYLMEVA